MNEQNPLISIIVPVYKAEEFLPACIDSILAQTYENLEIILVNDGSPDGCGALCDAYAEKDRRIKVIHKENGGVSAARNDALDIACGEYIGFVDSDDSQKPTLIEELYRNISETGADISICSFARCATQEISPDEILSDRPISVFDQKEALENVLEGKYFGGQLWSKLFRRELISDLRLDESIHVYEDLEFTVRALLKAEKVCYTPRALYNYVERDSSALHSTFTQRHLTAHDACMKIIGHLREHGMYDSLRAHLDAMVLMCNMILMRRLYGSRDQRKQFCRVIKKNIRAHLNKGSFSLLSRATRLRALLMATSSRLYFLVLKFHL